MLQIDGIFLLVTPLHPPPPPSMNIPKPEINTELYDYIHPPLFSRFDHPLPLYSRSAPQSPPSSTLGRPGN